MKSQASSLHDKTQGLKNHNAKEAENNPTMYDDYLFAASATDCTGLLPTVAHNETEAANYDDIAHYLPPIPLNPVTGAPEDQLLAAEGIHAEVNTLYKGTSSKKELEGNHIL